MDFTSFFNDLGVAFGYFYMYFSSFVSSLLERPITYFLLFTIIGVPALYFLIDWIQDFVSHESSKPISKFYKSNFRFSLPSALSPLKNRFWYNRSQAQGRLYKTQTIEMNGKKYRFVTSYKPRHDIGEKFNFSSWVKSNKK